MARQRHLLLFFSLLLLISFSIAVDDDAAVMTKLLKSIFSPPSTWGTEKHFCDWGGITCDYNSSNYSRSVTSIDLRGKSLTATLPSDLNNLSRLETLNLRCNNFTGPLPTLSHLTLLREVYISNNKFTSIPPDFFHGLINLQKFDISNNPSLAPWSLPTDLTQHTNLKSFYVNGANLIGSIPNDFDRLSNLRILNLSDNNLNGSLPSQLNKLNDLIKIDLSNNSFSGALPTLSDLGSLETLYLDNNNFTSIPGNFISGLSALKDFRISNNSYLEPWALPNYFGDINQLESFEAANASVIGSIPDYNKDYNSLETIYLSYNNLTGTIPASFAMSPISDLWLDNQLQGLSGTLDVISSMYRLKHVQLEANNFSGPIPQNLTGLPYLQLLDVSNNNNIYGYIPELKPKVTFLYNNTSILEQSSRTDNVNNTSIRIQSSSKDNVSLRVTIGSVIASVLALAGIMLFYKYYGVSRKSHFQITGSHGEIPISENGNVMISMQLLELVTDNFSNNNVLGRGGFGTVYKGELLDGTKIAVKKMKSDVNGTKGIQEFQAEIGVLTKVRHRHLVALLGYCINDNERLLVYEYMSRGTLSQHLFKWREHKSQPLSWNQRISIALYVGRGVEYMHNLAQQSFIHRDLKPANILLDNGLRAKVADFGLVKNAPDGKYSIETRLAGTFGYLAPEYATTGRVTTKVDVYAFGVILMQLITGRKAIDGSMPDGRCQLVTWFRMVPICQENMMKFIDRVLNTDDNETLESILKVAKLAHHCTAPEPFQRPKMGYVVGILAQLVEDWNPSRHKKDITYGHKHHMSLPKILQDNEADTSRMLNLFRPNSF
uniref:receptor-like kinase TMK4 n=1 Tax=Erigeron canadensis TaxID=72917 RepID=UPI001CB90087|nr:receptor-like kinase TMK4 [Erigeron canadensis]